MAGLHDKNLTEIADAIGMSRAGMAKIVDRDASKRSYPKAETAIKLADLFGVTLNDLYADPTEALLAAVARVVDAPIEEYKVPGVGTIKSRLFYALRRGYLMTTFDLDETSERARNDCGFPFVLGPGD